jgi:anti-sigma factor RsiW
MENKCENLSLYAINELTEREKKQFERHLQTCVHCQHELETLQETWQMLSFDIEEKDVPASLKSEVMAFVFEENRMPEQERKVKTGRKDFVERFKIIFTHHFTPLSTAVTAILVIGILGLLWNNLQLKDTITAFENKVIDPTQIVTTFSLKGQNLATTANGTAYLLKEDGDTRLVIALNNLPGTKEDEVYQVWLLKDGTKQNAGTLKPDQNGAGLTTYRLQSNHSFDDIGITLEPSPYNTQPEGQKVMGTS